MSLERITKMIVSSLTTQLLQLEDDLERAVNDDFKDLTYGTGAENRTSFIEDILNQMVIKEASLAKFMKLTINNETNKEKPKEHGEI